MSGRPFVLGFPLAGIIAANRHVWKLLIINSDLNEKSCWQLQIQFCTTGCMSRLDDVWKGYRRLKIATCNVNPNQMLKMKVHIAPLRLVT